MNIVTLVVFNLVKAGSKQTSQYETVLSRANPESKNECVQLEYLQLDPKDLLRVSNITAQLEKFDKRFEFNNSIHIEISASPGKNIISNLSWRICMHRVLRNRPPCSSSGQ